jgi:hypothetical protein
MKPSKTLLKSIEAYYRTLKEFDHQRAFHEGAVSVAFQTLLSDTARSHGWTLIPQLSNKRTGAGIRPDGTLKDQMNLVRGHWEAKDTSDNLEFSPRNQVYNVKLADTRGIVYKPPPIIAFLCSSVAAVLGI